MINDAIEATAQGRRARNAGDLPAARKQYGEAARLYRETNDSLAYAHCIRHIADIHQQEREPGKARPLYEEALELYRGNLDTKLLDLANAIRPYALLLEQNGDVVSAKELWKEAVALYSSLRVQAAVAECNGHLSELQS